MLIMAQSLGDIPENKPIILLHRRVRFW